jgi:hypothetical protein
LPLPRALEEYGKLVLLADLPGHSSEHVPDVLIERAADELAGWRGDVFIDVGDELVGGNVARRHEKPELVPQDRPTHRAVEVLDVRDAVGAREILRAHRIVDVVALPCAVGTAEEDAAADVVAAVLGNRIGAEPARLNFGRVRARAHCHFRAQRIVEVALLVRGLLAVHAHAVDVLDGVLGGDAVAARVGLLHLSRATHVGRAKTNAGHHHSDRHDVARRRQRVDQVARQHGRACCLGDVNERRLP